VSKLLKNFGELATAMFNLIVVIAGHFTIIRWLLTLLGVVSS